MPFFPLFKFGILLFLLRNYIYTVSSYLNNIPHNATHAIESSKALLILDFTGLHRTIIINYNNKNNKQYRRYKCHIRLYLTVY